jgi:hypothetical protein
MFTGISPTPPIGLSPVLVTCFTAHATTEIFSVRSMATGLSRAGTTAQQQSCAVDGDRSIVRKAETGRWMGLQYEL